MKISKLIELLEQIKEKEGDAVAVNWINEGPYDWREDLSESTIKSITAYSYCGEIVVEFLTDEVGEYK